MGAAAGRSTPSWVLTGGLAVIFLFPLDYSKATPDQRLRMIELLVAQAWVGGRDESTVYSLWSTFGSGLPTYLWNSILVSALTVALVLFVSLFGGYAFARFRFPGRNALFLLTLAILMVPYATLLIPMYVLLKTIGLQNSQLGLALVLAVFQLPFAVPRELEESAVVDGAGSFEVLRRIMLPAVRPGLITVALFAFLAAWNDFIAPLILLSDDKKATLPLAIATLRQQTMGVIDYGATEAGVVAMAVPCLILFILLQRHYVRGFMSGAIKG